MESTLCGWSLNMGRLDRGLATNNWLPKYPGTRVQHLRCDSLDHYPLLINPLGIDYPTQQKPFWFEEMWLFDSRYGETIKVTRRQSFNLNSNNEVLKKVKQCGKDLAWWNQNCFGNVRKELEKRKKKLLAQAEIESMQNGDNSRIRELKIEINVLLREAQMWSQRSRVKWVSQGDSNTKYFHSWATQ